MCCVVYDIKIYLLRICICVVCANITGICANVICSNFGTKIEKVKVVNGLKCVHACACVHVFVPVDFSFLHMILVLQTNLINLSIFLFCL